MKLLPEWQEAGAWLPGTLLHPPGPAWPPVPPHCPACCFGAGHCPGEGEGILGHALLTGQGDQTAEEENVANSLSGLCVLREALPSPGPQLPHLHGDWGGDVVWRF